MQEELQKLIDMYTLSPEQFEDYKKNVIMTLTTGVYPAKETKEVLMIVGGQPGAGKTRLSTAVMDELQKNAVKVDFDELRALHPFYQAVCSSYPEIVHRILRYDTDEVKKEVLKYLIDNGYNVIYEGALRVTQGFIDFTKDFREKGYNVKLNVMAVPELESYGSGFVRYAMALLTNKTPRWIEKSLHDESYQGVVNTVRAFEQQEIADDIRVFVRGDSEASNPQKIYSKDGNEYKDAVTAVEVGREKCRRKAVEDFTTKFNMVKGIFEQKCPELLEQLNIWKELYEKEQNYFVAFLSTTGIQNSGKMVADAVNKIGKISSDDSKEISID